MILNFLRRYWMIVVLVILLVAQAGQTYMLRQALQAERIDPKISGAATSTTPQVIYIQVPGASSPINLPLNIFNEPQPVRPGEPPKPPVVVADAPKVPCRTDEECRAIFGKSEQTITVNAALKTGTVVAVCLVDLINSQCPAGQTANRPLAEAFKFKIDLIRIASGAYTALEPEFGKLEISNVVTRTKPIEIVAGVSPKLPYNFGIGAKVIATTQSISAFGGPVYQNYGFGGIYSLGVGGAVTCLSAQGCNTGLGVAVEFVLPIR